MVGTLQINSIPEGAKIFLDLVDTLKITPAMFILEPGFHKYKLSLQGYLDINGEVNITDNQTTILIAALTSDFTNKIIQIGTVALFVSVIALIFRR